jgi:hypothetical protein
MLFAKNSITFKTHSYYRDMISKFINAGSFALILLCFLLPFLSVKCNNNTIEEFKATDFVFGTEYKIKSPADHSAATQEGIKNSEEIGSEENGKLETNGFMIALFIIVALGIIVSFLKIKKGRISAIITSGVGLLLLILAVIFIGNDFEEKAAIGNDVLGLRIHLGYEVGFWLMILGFVAIIIHNSILLILDSEKKIPPSSPLNDYSPPVSIDKFE